MKISVEYIRWLQEERSKINKIKLGDITFFENGLLLDIPKKVLEAFTFVGLNNTDFITSGFYKEMT